MGRNEVRDNVSSSDFESEHASEHDQPERDDGPGIQPWPHLLARAQDQARRLREREEHMDRHRIFQQYREEQLQEAGSTRAMAEPSSDMMERASKRSPIEKIEPRFSPQVFPPGSVMVFQLLTCSATQYKSRLVLALVAPHPNRSSIDII